MKKAVVEEENSSTKEINSRVELSSSEKAKLIPELRKQSRQKYLANREPAQRALLKQKISDIKKLFTGIKLTREEQMATDLDEKVLSLAEANSVEKITVPKEYVLPENWGHNEVTLTEREKALYKRYEDVVVDPGDNEIWESG